MWLKFHNDCILFVSSSKWEEDSPFSLNSTLESLLNSERGLKNDSSRLFDSSLFLDKKSDSIFLQASVLICL